MKEELPRGIRKYMEMNKNRSIDKTQKIFWDVAKAVLCGKFAAYRHIHVKRTM